VPIVEQLSGQNFIGGKDMSNNQTLGELRAEFGQSRFLAMPIAGTLAWSVAGILGAILPTDSASLALFICTGFIFPLGLLIAHLTGEDLLGTKSNNELDRLFGLTILMANFVWGIGIPFYMIEPSSLPLSVGIFLGLMWIPFSWMIQHWIGMFHAIARTALVVAAWLLFPDLRFVLIPALIVIIYLISIYVLIKRAPSKPVSTSVA